MDKVKKYWFISFALVVIVLGTINKEWIKEIQREGVKAKKVFDYSEEKFCINDFCLVKDSGEWWLEESKDGALVKEKAKSEVVEIYWGNIKEMSYDEVVSENSANFYKFDLGADDQETRLRVGEKNIRLGKVTMDHDGVYFMEIGGDEIYKSKVILDKETINKSEYWIEAGGAGTEQG